MKSEITLHSVEPLESALNNIVKKSIDMCKRVTNKNTVVVSVFPTSDKFIIDKMDGVSGFSGRKNMIDIYVYPTRKWKKALAETVVHELAHAVALNFNERRTIQDDLVFEGVAEHFREHFVGGGRAKWVKSIKKEKAKRILSEIRPYLKKVNEKLFTDLFYGTGKYPHWAGYAIGYYIVEAYLKKQKKVDWNKILRTSPNIIMRKSGFA